MDAKELRSKSQAELTQHLTDIQRELFNIRIQASVSGQYSQVHMFKKLKKEVARIKTVLHEGASK